MSPENYKSMRQRLGTQRAVAKMLGVARETVARRETVEGSISREAELAICWLVKATGGD